MFSENIKFFH